MTTDDLRTTPGSVIPDEAQSDEAIRAWMADQDDLRTRAREAADRNDPVSLEYRAGFADGAEWHAAQQPTREQIARALFLAEYPGSTAWDSADAETFGRNIWRRKADAVLALFDGGRS